MRKVVDSSFAIVSNGFADGPAQALRDFLNLHRSPSVITIFHPLVPESDGGHEITRYERGELVHRRYVAAPFLPPYTYLLDPLIPMRIPPVDGWFGFNNMAAARGLAARRQSRTGKVAYWCVDFVPNRFGRSPATWLYDLLDRVCCRNVDARFELSTAALDGRNKRLRISPSQLAPAHVAPMGAWLRRTPTTPQDGYKSNEVVYLGHLVERQGVDLLLKAAALNKSMRLRIIGGGPEEQNLQMLARRLEITDRVVFEGFVQDHKEVERLLAGAAIGVAPYREDGESFTRFADPGKLKAYLAAALPILLTATPPNAHELAHRAGAEVLPQSEAAWSAAVDSLLTNPSEWQRRRSMALTAARDFDWEILLPRALAHLDFEVE
ncbi:MAG TPA: glycosyltransferase [Actinomycetota bacterium]|nr:glycosyltransferase [Actinomycetota bacterium]